MRPQQNRRMRGRGGGNQNQNRKGPNPLTRNYESNGPDVKIRGSAQQIAEKYATLARDAQSAGDRVMAENYLQHAEHYNRIIMAALAQMPQQQQVRDARDDDDLDDEGDEGFQPVQAEQPAPRQTEQQPSRRERANGSGPQPVIEGVPAWSELDWVDGGADLTIGDVRFSVVKTIVRCLAITANPDTGVRDAKLLKVLTGEFGQAEPTLGVLLLPAGRGGRIRVGDPVVVG
ncbi:MAG: DUF4167 domain-containing protein [Aquamicrobium sp.]|nr:DUF4167 domain-containing protein [Aquamicrobium sp.]